MPEGVFLFVDFDDTLSDFSALGAQYVQEVSRLLSNEFGGDAAEWAVAVVPELEASVARYVGKFVGNPLAGYNSWIEEERVRVAEAIFGRAGRELPAGESPGTLAKRIQFDALTSCNAVFPGVEEALHTLFEADVRIQLASSQESDYLLAALIGGGIESCTESKYGPDLVDCAKEGPEFYRRIFGTCGISPSQAIVLDDQAICLHWAEEAGARVIQACLKADAEEPAFPVVLRSMAELPGLVERLRGESLSG
jgi:phosphoglycolate phosphatase-like HAD superfamily hydrolase